MFRNQLALGLKGMINKISSDNKSDNNSINNTPKHNSRSGSVSSEQQIQIHSNDSTEPNSLSEVQEVEGFLCPLCLRAFPSPESLSEHYSSEHSDFGNNFQCNVCKMKFGSDEDLETHYRRHHSTVETTDELIQREFSKMSSKLESDEKEMLRNQMMALQESKLLVSNENKSLREELATNKEQVIELQKQLTQLRANNDENDSNILKKELVKVQKLMNDLSVEREKEKELLNNEIKKQMEIAVNDRQLMNQELQDLKLSHKQTIDELMDMRSKKQKLEVELNLLRNEGITVSSLREDIENKCSVIGKLERSVDILTKQTDDLKCQLTQVQQERDHFKDETMIKKQMENQIIEYKQSAEKANKENIELNVMVSQLKSQFETLSAQYESLYIKHKVHEEMKAVGEQLDSKLAQQVESLKIDLMTAQQNLETLTTSHKAINDELIHLKKINQSLNQENEESNRNIISLNQQLNSSTVEFQGLNQNSIKKIEILENELKFSRNELESSRIAEKQVNSKLNENKVKVEELSIQLMKRETLLEQISEENSKYGTQISQLNADILKCNQQIDYLSQLSDSVQSENHKNEDKIKYFESNLLKIQNEKISLNEELSKLSESCIKQASDHQKEIEVKNTQINELTEKVVDIDQIYSEKVSLLSQLKESELKFTERLEKLNFEINEKNASIDKQLNDIRYLNECLISKEIAVKNFEQQLDILRNDNKELNQQLINCRKSFDITEDNYKDKCKQFDDLKNEMFSIRETLENRNSRLSECESELKDIKLELENSLKCNNSLEAKVTENERLIDNQKAETDDLRNELKNITQLKNELSKRLDQKLEEFRSKDMKNCDQIQSLNEKVITLRAGIEKEKSKQEDLQSFNDKLLGEKLELEAKMSNLSEEKRALIERCINAEDECQKLKTELFQMRHKLDDSMAALHELGRENQSLQIEQTKLVNRRWADDSDAVGCAKCDKVFSVTVRKHHCRSCGQIFCNECSSKTAIMALHPKPVRVCDNCYRETSKT